MVVLFAIVVVVVVDDLTILGINFPMLGMSFAAVVIDVVVADVDDEWLFDF